MSSSRFQRAFRDAMAAAEPPLERARPHWQLGIAVGLLGGMGIALVVLRTDFHWLVEVLALALALASVARFGGIALVGVAVGVIALSALVAPAADALAASLWELRRALLLSVVLAVVLLLRRRERERLVQLAKHELEGQGHRHQLLNSLLMANQDCMSLLDVQGRVLALNRSGVEQLQFESEAQAVGGDWLQWWPESQRENAAQRYRQALEGVPQRFECDCPTRAGLPRSWDVQLLAVRGLRGTVCAVLSIWRDVSAANEALRQASEARDDYAELLLRIDDAFLALDVQGQVVFANKEAEETLGSVGQPLLGANLWRLYSELNGSELQAQCLDSMQLGDSRRLQFFFRPHAVWLNIAIYPSKRGVALLLRDVTEQVRAGVQIERHQTRMHLAQEIAGFGDWEYDVLQGRLGLGEIACRLLGVEPQLAAEDGQRALLAAVAPEQRAEVLAHLLDRISRHLPIDVRFRRGGSGDPRYLWLRGQLTEDETGRLRHVVGTLHDVTESTLSIREATRDSRFFRAMIDTLPQHVCVLEEDGTIISTNHAWDAFARAAGADPDQVSSGANYLEVCSASSVEERDARAFLEGFEQVKAGRLTRYRQIYSLPVADDTASPKHWYQLDIAAMQPLGEARLLLVSHTDVSEQLYMLERLEQSEQRFRELAECLPDAFFVHDLGTDRLTYLSPMAAQLPGRLGKGFASLLAMADALDRESRDRWLSLILSEGWFERAATLTLTLDEVADGLSTIEVRYSPVRDPEGKVMRVVGLISDVSQRQQYSEQLRKAALADELTQLPNRLALMQALQAWSERASNTQPFALILVNVDDFKAINESLGHAAGDQLLAQLARRLVGLCEQPCLLSRLGGDEFALLVEDLQRPDQLAALAGEVRRRLATAFVIDGVEVLISVCMGVAAHPVDGQDPAVLLRCAALALESAKRRGPNSYSGFADAALTHVAGELRVKMDLMRALDRSEFELVYQPKFSAGGLRLCGFEALLRWRRGGGQLVSPAEFVPLLESSGEILKVGAWVLHQACGQAQRWRETTGVDLAIAVNVSALQMQDGRIVTEVASALTSARLDAACLELEITETALMRDPEQVVELTQRLRALGVRIALDDFGTRFSSLNYLHRFAPQVLKIDKCFIDDVDRGPRAAAMVHALIQLAHSLEMDVVAEGVERESQLRVLQGFGCDQVQGFLLGRPLSLEQVNALLIAQVDSVGVMTPPS